MNSQQKAPQSLLSPLSKVSNLKEKNITPLKNLTAESAFIAELKKIVRGVEQAGEAKATDAIKAMGYNTGATGGWLVNRTTSNEVLELFYAQTAIRQAGARIVDMDGIGTLEWNRMLAGATARWGAQGIAGADSSPQFGFVMLNLREAIAETLIPNRLLANSTVSIEDMVIQDLSNAVALMIDLSALRGSGRKPNSSEGAEPLGVRNVPNVTVTELGAGNGKIPQTTDMVNAYGRLEDANVPKNKTWGAIVSPRTRRTFENTTDTTGQLIPFERFSRGYPVHETTQIPNTLTVGSSSDCSEIYVGKWDSLLFGTSSDLEITVNTSRYVRERLVLVQVVMYVDTAVSHESAFQVLTGVRGQ